MINRQKQWLQDHKSPPSYKTITYIKVIVTIDKYPYPV